MNQILFIGYDAWHPQDFVYSYPDNQSSYLLLLTDSRHLPRRRRAAGLSRRHGDSIRPRAADLLQRLQCSVQK